MKGYWQASVICEGALDEDRQCTDTQLSALVADVEKFALAHPDQDVEIYTLWHGHPRAQEECACVQYATDHHPTYAWGPNHAS
jgi:hypothetical protein